MFSFSLTLFLILFPFRRTIHPDAPPLEVGERYWQYREAIVRCELFLIRMLGFNLRATLPHSYLTYYLRSLTNWIFADVDRRDAEESRYGSQFSASRYSVTFPLIS